MNAPDKKLLILYATAGAGHKKAAEAIEHAARKSYKDIELVDIVDHLPGLSARLYVDGYAFLIKHFPKIWGIIYFLSDSRFFSLLNVHLRRFFNRLMCGNLIRSLLKTQPDVILSTHFLASEIASYAKTKLGLRSKLITVVTDFGVHNFWIAPATDIYCCASDITKNILLKKGVPEDRIRVTGIPLDEKFLRIHDRNELFREFGLDPKLFTALIITGGIGAGPIEEIVELIHKDTQVCVVCGFNKPLFDRISRKNYLNVKLFEFVDYVEKLMRVSDIVITKAGGLTVTESLTMQKPMIFFFLIPGQEQINAQTICREDAGIIARSPREIRQAVLDLKNNPSKLQSFKDHARSLSKPDSVSHIISLIG